MNPFSRHAGLKRLDCDGPEIMVIRHNDRGAGLFAHFGVAVGMMKWAYDHGLVPYVDMQNADNCFTRGEPLAFNPWERFFDQVAECGPADLLRAKSVWIPKKWVIGLGWPRCEPAVVREDNPELLSWRDFVHAHIRVNAAVQAAVRERQAELFGGSRVLGCLVRGTDYTRMKPKMHPVQPDPEQVVADARTACRAHGYEKVFLASEDLVVRRIFREAFGDRLVTNQECLPDYSDGFLMSSGAVGDGARALEMSREYLVSVLLLARCQGLLAGCASGTVGALLFSDGYDWSRVYDLGFYA